VVAGLAARQHGVLTHRQLRALGFSAEQIKHRKRRARLHPVHQGVYALGRPELTQRGKWMAAVLACGVGAALSHTSAGAAVGLGVHEYAEIEVTVPSGRAPRRPGIRIHRRTLGPHEIAVDDRIPVTAPVTTLIDLAATLAPRDLEAAISDADRLDLITPDGLRLALEALPGRPGVARLRHALDRHTFRLTRSDLERRFLPIARGVGLGAPLTQVYVNGFEVDFFWPDIGLVIETDGLRYHRTAAQQARDALRDQTHTAAGLTPVRFTHAQVAFERPHVERTLQRVVSVLRDRRAVNRRA
jgi:very-short-patch-repair endonuclease